MEKERRKDNIEIAVLISEFHLFQNYMKDKIDKVEKSIDEFKDKADKCFVTQKEFEPIKKLVYGAVSVILLAVLGAIVALVVRQ